MVVHTNLNITDKFNIVGRGTVLSTTIERVSIDDLPFNIGEHVKYENVIYEIKGIEILSNAMPRPTTTNCGLLVKPVVDE